MNSCKLARTVCLSFPFR